jgi:hypothetical protein
MVSLVPMGFATVFRPAEDQNQQESSERKSETALERIHSDLDSLRGVLLAAGGPKPGIPVDCLR